MWLTLVVKTILRESKKVIRAELQTWSKDEKVMQRWQHNSIGGFMRVLDGALETESRNVENQRKETEQARKRSTLSKPLSIRSLNELSVSLPSVLPNMNIMSPLPPSSSSVLTSTTEPIISQHKRMASAMITASYGASSIESSPQSIDKSELHVQKLQNTFVSLIMEAVWKNEVSIPWIQGRRMWLNYVSCIISLHILLIPERM